MQSSDQLEEEEVTKPPLTGIPQIDYVWDPNLPRELNGYKLEIMKFSRQNCKIDLFIRFNLSTYPFLSSVPDAEDIDFKCDGLHDGFYASIKFGCQVCLFELLKPQITNIFNITVVSSLHLWYPA